MKVGGILLAAGLSRRYGSDKRQAALPDGRTLLASSLANLREAVDTVVVAVRQREPWLDALIQPLPGVYPLVVPDTRGMGDTLAATIRHISTNTDWEATVVALADMPWIQAETLDNVVKALAASPLVVPCHQGRRGHPVGFQACHFEDLMACQGDNGARWLLDRERDSLFVLEVDDAGVLRDVDRPTEMVRMALITDDDCRSSLRCT